ncbi:hypothetical protein SKAU_G00381430 [Synaphobranchus kaupii]|uniref:Secreted protein n=1 Tax=Synaphobranchus kaupii TaxID=118154 RepID=A0A9Q1EDS6_SYNKA|nr:hypothetical protein SKAU_G00381430 [Synaphobranchus kaupii]
MAKLTLLLFCSLAIATTLSTAAPVNTAKPTQIPALKGTPPSIPNGHVEALTIQEEEQQVGRTQATPTQTRMGRAASTPPKKVPHPCPGCFSVIGDPGTPQKGQ